MFKYLHQILKPYLDHYVFIGFIFAPLCILIPNDQGSILNPIRLGNDITIISSMKSIHLKYILIVVMSSSSILFLEVAVDNLFNLKNILASKGSLINLSILLVLLLSSAVSFFIALPYEDSDLMCRIFQIRNLVVCASVMSFSSRYGKTFWRDRILFVAYLFLCVGSLLRIASYSDSSVEQSSSSLIISTVGIIFQAFLSFLIIVYTIRWYIYLRKETFLRNITVDEWNTTLYMTMGSFTLIVFWVFNPLYGEKDYNDFSVAHLISIEVAFASFAVVQALYQTRSVRVESNKRKEELDFKRMFVNYISHEIRTPLNTAVMGLQVLYEELRSISPESLDTIRDIKTSCDIAVTTLNELLTFDKLEAGTLMVEKTQFNAFRLLEKTIGPFQVQARKSALTLSLRAAQHADSIVRTVVLCADKHKVSQIIRNMVSNGLKFTPEGGTVNVLVDVIDGTAEDGKACKMLKVDVVDSGAGISPENQMKLFKEIVQFNPGKLQKGGGSGLGLYISHGIAKLHGGGLSVHSRGEGHGCTFTLTMPILPDEKLETAGKASRRFTGVYNAESMRSDGSSSRNSVQAFQSIRIASDGRENKNSGKISHSTTATTTPPRGSVLQSTPFSNLLRRMNSNSKVAVSPDNDNDDVLSTIESEPGEYVDSGNSSVHNMKSSNMAQRVELAFMEIELTEVGKDDGPCDKQTKSDIILSVPLLHNLRILVVDDSAMNRKMQCRLLKNRCVSCIEAENGQEAVNKVKMAMKGGNGINPINLVVMDCNMPVMNGMDAAKAMRDMGYKGLIIGVTGNVTIEYINTFISHGADVVLAKPLNIQKFDIVVNNLVLLNQ